MFQYKITRTTRVSTNYAEKGWRGILSRPGKKYFPSQAIKKIFYARAAQKCKKNHVFDRISLTKYMFYFD